MQREKALKAKTPIKGYKVFDSSLKCHNFQYKVGETFSEDVTPCVGERGFHYCATLADCVAYTNFDKGNRVCEVEALGDIDAENPFAIARRYCTNKIKIIRELNEIEIFARLNIGYYNTGTKNIGHSNTGSENIGFNNEGNSNVGSNNVGSQNVGSKNTGRENVGILNAGNSNVGKDNIGSYNIGDKNKGSYNIGDNNFGCHNNGNYNFGSYNVGDANFGDYNSGSFNLGCNCVGDFNSVDFCVGCFNNHSSVTVPDKGSGEGKLMFFNKASDYWDLESWQDSEAYMVLRTIRPVEHSYSNIPDFMVVMVRDYHEMFLQWWNTISIEQKAIITQMPNFDYDIFKNITSINITDEEKEQIAALKES